MAYSPPGQSREKVYKFVRGRLLAGCPPTVREVQEAFGFRAVESARSHLEALVADGRLVKEQGRARGYRLPDAGGRDTPLVFIPLLGRVPAGPLDLATEDPDGYLTVQTRMPPGELFALRVQGDSMVNAGILDGDIVFLRQQPTAENGDVVVAMADGEATVKIFRREGRRIELHPENPAYSPIVYDSGEVTILGKVFEVRRYLDGVPLQETRI